MYVYVYLIAVRAEVNCIIYISIYNSCLENRERELEKLVND